MLGLLLMMAAQPGPDARPLAALAACHEIGDNVARLACYDREAGAIAEAQRRKDIVVLDRAEVQKTKRSLFGFSLPSIKLFGDGRNDEQLKQLVGKLTASTSLPGGLMRFSLDDGGQWQTTEQSMMAPRVGDTVTIKAGALGSYVATAPGRRAVRVYRVH